MSGVINEEILAERQKYLFKKGALVSYKGMDDKKIFGIIDSIENKYHDGDEVWAYWQEHTANVKEFSTHTTYAMMQECTLERNWSQIKDFENIPDFALTPKK